MTPIQYIIYARETEAALAAGCRWLQLYTGENSNELTSLLDDCHASSAYLLLTDDVEGCKTIVADGVVLTSIADSVIPAARRTLGEDSPQFIGALVSTEAEAITAAKSGVDFIQAPAAEASIIVGAIRAKNLTTPVVALGTVDPADVPALLDAGISGIAVNSTDTPPILIPTLLTADEQ